ncbi:hypothetical protein ACJJTC_003125 [Scirpophaga incertulas]
MKFLLMVALLVAAAVAVEKYSEEHDSFDVDALVASTEELRKFNNCFIDKDSCSELALHFKKDLGDAVQTSCSKCNDRQKYIVKTYFAGLKEKLPEDFEVFKTKYDPENKLFDAFLNAVQK